MQHTKLKISIITVVFNGSKYLEKTIQSVINQTYQNIEYIIIDGGSTDGTLDIIKKYEDKITYWLSEPDEGIYYAMNKGISVATGDWVNFMNSGDCFYNNHVLKTIFGSQTYDKILVISGKVAMHYGHDFLGYYGNERISPHQGMFICRTVIQKHIFDLSLTIVSDMDMQLSVAKEKDYKKKYINISIASFYTGGIGNHPKFYLKKVKEIIRVYKKHDLKVSINWYLAQSYEIFGIFLYYLLGEKFYYKKFVKSTLKKINARG